MKTIQTTVYELDELSLTAQKKAIEDMRDDNDYMFLSDELNNRLYELLKENNIIDHNDTNKPNTKPTQVLYSLTYSQGDGACFEGSFTWKDYTVTIKHSGHYCHSNSKTIAIEKDYDTEATEKEYNEFESIYQDICKKLEKYGYSYIDNENSEDNIRENILANEYTFTIDGKMKNA